MDKKSKSKATGALNAEEEKQPLAMQSSSEASTRKQANQTISDMSENSPSQRSPLGFQPTQALGEIDETTANVQVLLAFADKLGGLIFWKKLELADGQEVFALCFPLSKWSVNSSGGLAASGKKTG